MKSMKRDVVVKNLMLFSLTFLVTGTALADRSHSHRYYTREDVVQCNNAGRNTVIGGALGLGLGMLLGDGDTGTAIAGAAVGGLLGLGLSCDEEVRYVEHVDHHLSRKEYWRPYESRDRRVVVIQSGYGRNREICRTYHSEFYTRRGWVSEERTACYVNGHWRHGYDRDFIVRRTYFNDRPDIRIPSSRHDRQYDRRSDWDRRDSRGYDRDDGYDDGYSDGYNDGYGNGYDHNYRRPRRPSRRSGYIN